MIKAIIFDFDGTLINTNQLVKDGLNNLAQIHLGRPLTHMELCELNGKHLNDQIRYITKDNIKQTVLHFKKWYAENHNKLASTFKGIPELLQILRHEKIQMGIVSNNSTLPVQQGLNHLNFNHYFQDIITSDDVAKPKPDPEGIECILKKMNLRSEEVLYVGDSPSDVLAAKNANVKSCLVDWTVLSETEKRKLSADYRIQKPLEILSLIKEINVHRIKDDSQLAVSIR